jgi:hypothetical protein
MRELRTMASVWLNDLSALLVMASCGEEGKGQSTSTWSPSEFIGLLRRPVARWEGGNSGKFREARSTGDEPGLPKEGSR